MVISINNTVSSHKNVNETLKSAAMWNDRAAKTSMFDRPTNQPTYSALEKGQAALKYSASEMIGNASMPMFATDSSHARLQYERDWKPVIYTAGALITFLVVISFLKKN